MTDTEEEVFAHYLDPYATRDTFSLADVVLCWSQYGVGFADTFSVTNDKRLVRCAKCREIIDSKEAELKALTEKIRSDIAVWGGILSQSHAGEGVNSIVYILESLEQEITNYRVLRYWEERVKKQ